MNRRAPSPALRLCSLLPALLAAALGCHAAQSEAKAPTPAASAASSASLAPTASPAAPSTPLVASAEQTPARQEFDAWLQAFNSGDRSVLLAFHEHHFPYAVAVGDMRDIEREYGLSQGTGGFELRRIEASDPERLVALLQEHHGSQYARVTLQVSAQAPHAVTKFDIGPVPTPPDLLTPAERQARSLDATQRRAVLASIGEQLQAHYLSAETAGQVIAALDRKRARGDYDTLSDAFEFADVLTRDLWRLARDKHIGLNFGPMPPPPDLAGSPPPWLARSGYGFGAVERLRGNVALLVINGFPPFFEAEQAAIAERMSQIADADAAIVDLRNNNGGFPPTGSNMASYFFDAQPVHLMTVYRRDNDRTDEVWTQQELRGHRFGAQKPLYVLTGPHTFSGGEAFAYQLQAQGRAIVVGAGTGGGAHLTQPYPVAGGFVLRVPWGEPKDPITGTNWEGVGVVPDVAVPADHALETAHRLALERLGRR